MKGKRQEVGGRSVFKNLKLFSKLFTFYFLLFTFIGCETVMRKFSRKPKKEEEPAETMVLVPEEYKAPSMSKEELYRQYFLYWKSWQDELLESLQGRANHKKQIECIDEAISNLSELKPLLNSDKQKELDAYINQLRELKTLITKDLYGNNIDDNRLATERLKRNILRDFSYNKISKDISYETLYQK
jgi:hypothetical protein